MTEQSRHFVQKFNGVVSALVAQYRMSLDAALSTVGGAASSDFDTRRLMGLPHRSYLMWYYKRLSARYFYQRRATERSLAPRGSTRYTRHYSQSSTRQPPASKNC